MCARAGRTVFRPLHAGAARAAQRQIVLRRNRTLARAGSTINASRKAKGGLPSHQSDSGVFLIQCALIAHVFKLLMMCTYIVIGVLTVCTYISGRARAAQRQISLCRDRTLAIS